MYKQEYDTIEEKIVEERNIEIIDIEKDIANISEIMFDLAVILNEQGETITTIEKSIAESNININESVISLEKAETFNEKNTKMIRNTIIIVGGLSLGALGFIAGPLVGLATIITGTLAGTGIVIAI